MSTVTRVLPWRRHSQPPAMELREILAQYRKYHPRQPTDAISEAYRMTVGAHEGQLRRSGEPYVTHPLAVAGIVARYGMDETSIIAALLHDAVEDTSILLEEIEEHFGDEVAAIVDGVTKLERIHFESKEAQQAATMRKMLVAMAKDLRVLVIKLADRLHNMRTIAALPAWNQERKATETLDIYAPLAHRLGMQEIRQQLEDLCFASLHPKRYAEIDFMVADRSAERAEHVQRVIDDVRKCLSDVGIQAEISGRPKHLWSIYEKMMVKGKPFSEIFDLIGIRVIVPSTKDCYAALGMIHAMWPPIPGRFKDYIAMPKFNLYQSLHTTVIPPDGKVVEVQFRTPEMHHRAEWGVAAHFNYKEGQTEDLTWLSRIVDFQEEMTDPGEFMANLKLDLDQGEVFVFTPKGDITTLPAGATPVDFAYSIHTEVGHRCIGARVSGRLVPLDYKLQSGDSVEIFTSKIEGAGPSQDWLNFVATRSAANKIRHWFSRERREDAQDAGREALMKAMRREALPVQKILAGDSIKEVANQLGYDNDEALFTSIGEHHHSAESIARKISSLVRAVEPAREEVLATSTRTLNRRRNKPVGVHVEGYDDVLVRMARCCTPVPGDNIIGFITRGRGVSVHRSDCQNAMTLAHGESERMVEVQWDATSDGHFVAVVEVKALDRPKLLQDVIGMLSEHQVNILGSQSHLNADRVARMRFEFELGDPAQLHMLLNRLRTIENVYDANRVMPGAPSS